MLAQVFNPTEIKKNGPATRPATAPARRVASLRNARLGGACRHGQKLVDTDASSINAGRIGVLTSTRDAKRLRVNLRYSDQYLIPVA
jgi:hypothetical protein